MKRWVVLSDSGDVTYVRLVVLNSKRLSIELTDRVMLNSLPVLH